MPHTRRHFLQTATLSAAATALATTTDRISGQSAMQVDARIDLLPGEPIGTIAPEVYGHFIEQLGGVIYDGVWVGENSKVANVKGIRKAFLDTMKEIQAPVMRWPGGCFADSYDWRDGIGPRPKRPQRTAFWTQEDTNAFGVGEFMEACRYIGCQPYLAADLRSMPARDFYQWVEYCNSPKDGIDGTAPNALATERARNGSPEPYNVQYWGVGNEVWGCGGNQTAEEYAGEYRRYTAWVPKYGAPNTPAQDLRYVACGPNGYDLAWTRAVARGIGAGHLPWGWSCHYYTSGDAKKFAAGDALAFTPEEHYDLLARASFMERIVQDHYQVLGEVDRNHRVKLVIDEWGAWYGKGTELTPHYNLSQQSTMRDALLTGITLDIFQRNAEKIGMANVAQTINCIHSLMLAEGDRFTVTPTFHVFKMYMPHKGATAIRAEFAATTIPNPLAQETTVGGGNNSTFGSISPNAHLAGLSGSASLRGKTITLSVVNPHLDRPLTTEIALYGGDTSMRGSGSSMGGATIASVTGMVLSEPDIHAHNDFAHPNAVHPKPAQTMQHNGTRLMHTFPPASVTTLQLTLA
jgi:alpha-N-arabinofuranosidase